MVTSNIWKVHTYWPEDDFWEWKDSSQTFRYFYNPGVLEVCWISILSHGTQPIMQSLNYQCLQEQNHNTFHSRPLTSVGLYVWRVRWSWGSNSRTLGLRNGLGCSASLGRHLPGRFQTAAFLQDRTVWVARVDLNLNSENSKRKKNIFRANPTSDTVTYM